MPIKIYILYEVVCNHDSWETQLLHYLNKLPKDSNILQTFFFLIINVWYYFIAAAVKRKFQYISGYNYLLFNLNFKNVLLNLRLGVTDSL